MNICEFLFFHARLTECSHTSLMCSWKGITFFSEIITIQKYTFIVSHADESTLNMKLLIAKTGELKKEVLFKDTLMGKGQMHGDKVRRMEMNR